MWYIMCIPKYVAYLHVLESGHHVQSTQQTVVLIVLHNERAIFLLLCITSTYKFYIRLMQQLEVLLRIIRRLFWFFLWSVMRLCSIHFKQSYHILKIFNIYLSKLNYLYQLHFSLIENYFPNYFQIFFGNVSVIPTTCVVLFEHCFAFNCNESQFSMVDFIGLIKYEASCLSSQVYIYIYASSQILFLFRSRRSLVGSVLAY